MERGLGVRSEHRSRSAISDVAFVSEKGGK